MIRWITACSTAKCTRGELVVDALEATHGLCHRMHGQPGGTRTPDLLLRRQLLYPVELRAVMEALPALPVQYGAARPIRTRNRRCDRTHRCHRRSRRRWWQDPGCYGETGRTSCPDMSASLCRALHDTPRNGESADKKNWSEQRDSNSRPSGPKPDALPDCAMLREGGHCSLSRPCRATGRHTEFSVHALSCRDLHRAAWMHQAAAMCAFLRPTSDAFLP